MIIATPINIRMKQMLADFKVNSHGNKTRKVKGGINKQFKGSIQQ
jgi:hypothetical protein